MSKKSKPKAESLPVNERRVWVRYSCDMSIKCRSDDANPRRRAHQELGKRFAARVSNISRGGMRVEATCPFENNAKFDIELDRGPRQTALVLSAYAKQITQIDSGHWSIGCAFTQLLDEDELKELLRFGPGKGFQSGMIMCGLRSIRRAVAGLLAFVGLG